jgi:hypothetical protein
MEREHNPVELLLQGLAENRCHFSVVFYDQDTHGSTRCSDLNRFDINFR